MCTHVGLLATSRLIHLTLLKNLKRDVRRSPTDVDGGPSRNVPSAAESDVAGLFIYCLHLTVLHQNEML